MMTKVSLPPSRLSMACCWVPLNSVNPKYCSKAAYIGDPERLLPAVFLLGDSFLAGVIFFFVAVAMFVKLFFNPSAVE
jgi:hypothetical protein